MIWNSNNDHIRKALHSQNLLDDNGLPLSSKLTRPVVAIIPAAGKGSRLKWDGPKIMFPVGSEPILHWLIDIISPLVNSICLVINPAHEKSIRKHVENMKENILLAFQHNPTGMGDAILCAEASSADFASQSDFLIIWGDQVTLDRNTITSTLLYHQVVSGKSSLTFPTCPMKDPYIHFERDENGNLKCLRQKREGDAMPEFGESDCGVFIVKGSILFDKLKEHKATAAKGGQTREFNFLPFIIWLQEQNKEVSALPIADVLETRGINSLEDVEFVIKGKNIE